MAKVFIIANPAPFGMFDKLEGLANKIGAPQDTHAPTNANPKIAVKV